MDLPNIIAHYDGRLCKMMLQTIAHLVSRTCHQGGTWNSTQPEQSLYIPSVIDKLPPRATSCCHVVRKKRRYVNVDLMIGRIINN